MRSTLTGYVGDKPTFVIDHVTRMRDDIAPDWPQPYISIPPKDLGYGQASGRGVYRVEIDGSPSMRCEFETAEDHDCDDGCCSESEPGSSCGMVLMMRLYSRRRGWPCHWDQKSALCNTGP